MKVERLPRSRVRWVYFLGMIRMTKEQKKKVDLGNGSLNLGDSSGMEEDAGEFWRQNHEDSLLDEIDESDRQKQPLGTSVAWTCWF